MAYFLMSDTSINFMYLQGQRDNIFAIIYLVLYSGYLFYMVENNNNELHIIALIMIILLLSIYPLISDFTRILSIITPIHLLAAVRCDNTKTSMQDILVVSVMSYFTLTA